MSNLIGSDSDREAVCNWRHRAIAILTFSVWYAVGANAHEFNLQFSLEINDSSGLVAPDNFYAAGSDATGVLVGYDPKDLRKQPRLPGSYALIEDIETGMSLIKDCRPFSTGATSLSYLLNLIAYDSGGIGLTGVSTFKLLNPEGLGAIPADTMVYVRHYDAAGNFIHHYNMRNPAEQTIVWNVANVNGNYATMELVILNKCLAANLDNQGRVNLHDFSLMAKKWQQFEEDNAGDIDGDNKVDFHDVVIMAENWLSQCSQ